jgi:hypothetical protein
LSDASWTIILTAKNSTIQMIRKVRTEDIVNADGMREKLNDLLDKQSQVRWLYLKKRSK